MQENSSKIILDLCGGTGAWSRPYQEAGYDVRVITLPKYDVTQGVLTDQGIIFKRADNPDLREFTIPYADIYGILAAPPCTEFSIAKGARERDFDGAMAVVRACLNIIWRCRLEGNLKFWALENPVGFLRQFIGIPAYQFEQWQFGAEHIKPTDLWGYFKAPSPTVKIRPANLSIKVKGSSSNGRLWAKPVCPPEFSHLNLNRTAIRAITPAGFAQAFF